MQEIAKEELMSTLDPTSTTAHVAECSLCHAARQCPLGGVAWKDDKVGTAPPACSAAQRRPEAHMKE